MIIKSGKNNPNKLIKRGFTLVEMVIYVTLVALVLSIAIGAFVTAARSYRTLKSDQTLANASLVSLERLVRELRGAVSVDGSLSVLGAHPGRLTLNTLNDDGLPVTTEFYLVGQTLHLRLDGVEQGALTPASVRVTNLVFRLLDNGQSKAVKIELTLEAGEGASLLVRRFYSTVVLRGSYPVS